MQRDYPLLTLANVERYVLTGAVDAVNIAGSQYAASKIQPDAAAITNFWQRFRLLSWKTLMPGLYIGSREIGLTHAGPDRQIVKADADRLVKERVDEPLRTGADHVILWTWKQTFDPDGDGPAERQTWRLADQGAQSNSIVTALGKARRPLRLAVTYNPREQETNIASDVKAIADIAPPTGYPRSSTSGRS
ncbi:hypothetical protein [Nonomuraea recticatena]|uniref:Uncharacterized protein n=1 Tax=Nonomuraea recticatena TaxID=46178 RepID=A0ABP6FX60_9ACTN